MTNPPSPAALAALLERLGDEINLLLWHEHRLNKNRDGKVAAALVANRDESRRRLVDMYVSVASSAIPSPTPEPSAPRECSWCGWQRFQRDQAGAAPPKGPWSAEQWPHQAGWQVLRHDPDTPLYVERKSFNTKAEAIAVRDTLNAVASRVATGKGE